VLVIDTGLDVDGGLLLRGIAQRRLTQHRHEAVSVLEVSEPRVAFALAAGNDVVQIARFERSDIRLAGIVCSEQGAIKRLSVITHASRRTRSGSSHSPKMRSSSSRRQN
jgi:hypothetical protein